MTPLIVDATTSDGLAMATSKQVREGWGVLQI